MNAKEALNIVANATGHLQGTRKDHEVIAQAIDTLRKLVENDEAARVTPFDPAKS